MSRTRYTFYTQWFAKKKGKICGTENVIMVSYKKRKFTGPAFPVSNHEPQARSEIVSLVEARPLRFNSPFEVCVSHIRVLALMGFLVPFSVPLAVAEWSFGKGKNHHTQTYNILVWEY